MVYKAHVPVGGSKEATSNIDPGYRPRSMSEYMGQKTGAATVRQSTEMNNYFYKFLVLIYEAGTGSKRCIVSS